MVSGFPFAFFIYSNIRILLLSINCLCVSTELCNKAYFVKINAETAYFIMVAAKMSAANLNLGGTVGVFYSRVSVDQT